MRERNRGARTVTRGDDVSRVGRDGASVGDRIALSVVRPRGLCMRTRSQPINVRNDADHDHHESAAQHDVVEIDLGATDVVALALVVERTQDAIGRARRIRKVSARSSLGDDALVLARASDCR